MKKICITCKISKPLEDFYVHKNSKDGYRNSCKVCRLSYAKERRSLFPPELGKRNEYLKQWKKENPEKYKQSHKESVKRRIKTKPMFKFKRDIRNMIGGILRDRNYTKDSKTFEILGIDLEGLCKYIENQFTDGMTWENKGEWEMDHKIPISLGKTKEDIIRLNHYTNFRPLWRKDNNLKSDKVLPEFEHLIVEYIK